MKIFFRSRYLLIGILAGIFTGGGWLAWAAIQSQVGNNIFDEVTKSWRPARQILNTITDTNGGRLPNNRGITASGMIVASTSTANGNYSILAGAGTSGGALGNNSSNLGVPIASVTHLWTGSSWSQLYSAGIGGSTASSDNLAGTGPYIFNGNSWNPFGSINSSLLSTGDRVAASGTVWFDGTNYVGVTAGKPLPVAPALNGATTPSDTFANPTTANLNSSLVSIFNGTTWDRQRSATADTLATGLAASAQMSWNGSSWDRVRNASIGEPTSTTGLPISQGYIFNGSSGTYERARSANQTGTISSGIQAVSGLLFNNTAYERPISISSANLSATTSTGAILSVPLSTWSITNTPAAATQATISKAASGAGARHVATSISACTAQTAAGQTPIAINLRDGATGAGTILRTWKIATVLGDSRCIDISNLSIIGSINTAMTIEFAAAGVAGSEQTVNMSGFSVP